MNGSHDNNLSYNTANGNRRGGFNIEYSHDNTLSGNGANNSQNFWRYSMVMVSG